MKMRKGSKQSEMKRGNEAGKENNVVYKKNNKNEQ